MTTREATVTAREAAGSAEDRYWYVNVMAAAVVILVHATITERVYEDLRTVVRILVFLMIVLLPHWSRSALLWAGLFAIFGLQVILTPFDLPNHHYALTYLVLAVALALSAPDAERERVLRTGARWLIVGIMAFATVHKMLSASFVDGSYLGYVLATGGFASPVLTFCGQCQSAVAANVTAVEAFRQTVPSVDAAAALVSPLPHLPLAARGFAFAIIAVEAWLALVFLAAPDRRLAHWSLILFAGSLGILRQEFLFIAVVSALGLLSCRAGLRWERRAYALAIVLFAAGAIS